MLEEARADRGPQPLRHRQHAGRPPPEPGAQGQRHVQEGHRLHRQGRQGRHHRRIHRPDDGRAALVRRPSPGGRGQGRRDIEPENQTLASITFQNYFRMYPKLSGMTGTAMTEAPEFFDIYKMNVVSIPTNVRGPAASTRTTNSTRRCTDKFAAIAKEIKAKQEIGQPVLVGTVSIEKSEMLSEFLDKEGIQHSVLNARFHEQEAHIVAQAGPPGRGDDRHQHGRPRHRHPVRRQPRFPDAATSSPSSSRKPEHDKRGRADRAEDRRREAARARCRRPVRARHRAPRKPAHRQPAARPLGPPGRPGLSRFYLSLDDDLLRIFGPQTMFARLMNKNLEDGEAIVSPVDLQGDRDRAEEGRGAQLRHPQAGRRIRRRDERPAQGHLRAARGHHGCRKRQRRDRRHARRDRVPPSSPSTAPRAPIPSSGTSTS